MTRELENGKRTTLTAVKVRLSLCHNLLIIYPKDQPLSKLWFSVPGKGGARGHKISDYFEVSGRI